MLDASAKQGILKPIRVVLVDRQPIVLQGLKSVLGTQQDFDVVASTCDWTSCLGAIRSLTPDVALIADALPDATASDILAIVKAEKLSTRLVFFTESDSDHNLTAAIAVGACSAISKYSAPATMLRSLRLMTKSGVSLEQSDLLPTGKEADGGGKIEKMLELLTPREVQIVRLVSEGMSNKEIARTLDVSQGTVKVHLHNIFQKLEITNRTVLATISLLQRTSGFSALALGFLAFAIADELKASEANDMFGHDDGPGQMDEPTGHEVWKKAILQHLIVSKSGGAPAFTERDLLAKASLAANPAAAMDVLRTAEQFLGSKQWKDGGPVGSSTSSLPAHLPRAVSDTEIGAGSEHQIPRPASNPIPVHGGYGTFAALAGALIYDLSDSHFAAQARELDQASIDSFLAGIGDKATTKLAAVRDADADHADSIATNFLSHDFSPHSAFVTPGNSVTQESAQGQAGPDAAGRDVQKPVGLLDSGPDSGPDGYSRDQLMGGDVVNIASLSPIDSKSVSSDAVSPDSVSDVATGPGRLNLAAFGGLAFLHLTTTVKSIPPHTLAWIYDPASNQTIVYVNPTDHPLDIGDHGLLEIHLQGIVSVAAADLVHQSEGTAVAVTLEQLEQALMAATIDEAALSTNSGRASEDSGAAAVWSASADDGFSFQFAHVRTGSGTSAKSNGFGSDSADATEESASASGVPAYGSSIAPGHGESPPAVENLSAKNVPTNPNTGAPSTQQSELVQPGFNAANSSGHGHSEHTAEPGSAKAEMAQAESEPGNGVGHGNEHHSQTPDTPPGAVRTAESGGAEHSNSGHAASAQGVGAGEIAASPGHTEHRHSQQAAEPGSVAAEMAEAKSKSGNGVGNDHEHPSQTPDTPPGTVKTAGSGGAEQGNAGHAASAQGVEAVEITASPGHAEHRHSQQAAAEPGSAAADMAEAKSKSGNGVGNNHEHHSQTPDTPPGAVKTAESGGAEQSNSGHAASAQGVGVVAVEMTASPGYTERRHSQQAAEPGSAAAEMAEAKSKSGNGVGNDHEHHSQTPDTPPQAVKTAESGGAEHGNSGHAASAQGVGVDAGEMTASPGHTEHRHSQQAAEPGSAAAEMAEAKSKIGNGVGNDHEHHSQTPDTPPGAVKTAESGGAEQGNSGHAASAQGVEAVEMTASPGHTEHRHSQQAAEPGPASVEMAEVKFKPGNGVGNDHEHHSQTPDTPPEAVKTAESGGAEHSNAGHAASAKGADAGESVATHGNTDHGNSQQVVHFVANLSEAEQPATAAFDFGSADQQPVFRFDGEDTPSTLVTVREPKELADPHVTRDQKDAPQKIVEIVPGALDEQAAHHRTDGPHHGVGHAPHDWLI
ncbi:MULTISPECIES: response regulator transcription factor [Bradyrhizobium]|uniref:response regulator transcription factor n=1 Tax=Bradyrhizobium TaxID=374 RepID=UPI00293E2C51|nr:response regulator transcription factor [Bradyrhizobium sp. NDS-1]WOH75778.1 response regulator transcription factor [Bradyrhizobium sp. NDS-1]